MAQAPDKASYQALQFAMQDGCYSNHFKKWTFPGFRLYKRKIINPLDYTFIPLAIVKWKKINPLEIAS